MASGDDAGRLLRTAHLVGVVACVAFIALEASARTQVDLSSFNIVSDAWTTVAIFGLVSSLVLDRWQHWRQLFAEVVFVGVVWVFLDKLSQVSDAEGITFITRYLSAATIGYAVGLLLALAIVVLRPSVTGPASPGPRRERIE
jgi:drug/metabolite transporter (DMT)-like permease